MNYYNLEQTLELFQTKLPETLLPFDLPQLADLCRRGEVTPVFSHNRYVIIGRATNVFDRVYLRYGTVAFNGYITSDDLASLLTGYESQIKVFGGYIYEEIGDNRHKGWDVCLETEDYDIGEAERNGDGITYTIGEPHYISKNDLLFPIQEIKIFIDSKHTNELKVCEESRAMPILEQIEPIASRAGISLEKQQAKETARILAKVFWEYDTEKEIKITEMCLKVFIELKDSAFLDQLPDQYSRLKSWIEKEAPEYARIGGRPIEK